MDIVGFSLLFIGIAIALVAFALALSSGRGKRTSARGGGIILIGPIPIVFGSDAQTVRGLLYIALALTVFLAVVFVLPRIL